MTVLQSISLFVGLCLFCIMQALFWAMRRSRAQRDLALQSRLRASEYGEDLDGVKRQDRSWVLRWEIVRKLDGMLAQAGMEVPVGRFLLITGLVLFFLMVLVAIGTGNPFSGIILDVVVGLMVVMVINAKRRRRLDGINEQLPSALELMTFSLRAGHTLEEAINFVSKEVPEPLAGELRRVYEEYEMGRPLQNALFNMALRLSPCGAMRTFVEAVLVLKQTGGNLVEIIETLIDTLRAQAAYEARHRALTAEGRTSGIILGSLPLLILATVLIIQPGYVGSLLINSQGQFVLFLALGLWGLGILWLYRLLRPTT